MLDGYIADLEAGDVFRPVRFTATPFVCSEYAHGMEEPAEWFYAPAPPFDRQVRLPTAIHSDKMRLLEENCLKEQRLKGEEADDARIHYEYWADHHAPVFAGDELVISGRISDRYERRGREYLCYELELHSADGRLLTTYRDKTLLRYRREGE